MKRQIEHTLRLYKGYSGVLFQSMSAPLIVHRSRQHLVLAGNDMSNISAAMYYDAKDTCGHGREYYY